MAKQNCPNLECPYVERDVISTGFRVVIGLIVGVAILHKPILNGLGIENLEFNLTDVSIVFKGTLLSPAAALILGVFRNIIHKEENYWNLILDSAGVAALILTLLITLSY